MDSEYVPKHTGGNLTENKIRFDVIYNEKGCAQSDAGQDPNTQYLHFHRFACDAIINAIQ